MTKYVCTACYTWDQHRMVGALVGLCFTVTAYAAKLLPAPGSCTTPPMVSC